MEDFFYGYLHYFRVTKSRPTLERFLYFFRVLNFLEQILFLSATFTMDFLHLECGMSIAFSGRTRRFPLIHGLQYLLFIASCRSFAGEFSLVSPECSSEETRVDYCVLNSPRVNKDVKLNLFIFRGELKFSCQAYCFYRS